MFSHWLQCRQQENKPALKARVKNNLPVKGKRRVKRGAILQIIQKTSAQMKDVILLCLVQWEAVAT